MKKLIALSLKDRLVFLTLKEAESIIKELERKVKDAKKG